MVSNMLKIIQNKYKQINNNEPITLTIGNFDGFHLGHRLLVKTTKSFTDTKSALMTFNPPANRYFSLTKFLTLSTINDKQLIANQLGLDLLIEIVFDNDFAKLSKEEFINFLKKIKVKRLVVGSDFKFGAHGLGTIDDLLKEFEVIVVSDVYYRQIKVSTSYIKELITTTQFEIVKELLTREYQISGMVINGKKLGRTIGFPTANLDTNGYYLPKNGVYLVEVVINGCQYFGVASLGYNPTISSDTTQKLEVYIFNFSQNIYKEVIKLTFIEYLRPEIKFESLQQLKNQIQIDVNNAQNLLKLKEIVLK